MKIYLDDLVFSLQKIGGISVFWNGFLERINLSDSEQFCLIHVSGKKNLFSSFKWDKEKIKDIGVSIKLLRALPLVKRLNPQSIFHSSYLRISLQKDVCNIVTIHDLAAEDSMIGGLRRYLKLGLQYMAIKKADGIICVSETTKKNLLVHYPKLEEDRIKVILHGCSAKFLPMDDHHTTSEQFLLFVGGRGVYKNFAACLETMKTLQDYRLVMVGGGALSIADQEMLDEILPGRYEHHDELDTVSLNILYNKAHCLFYPTIYEGFGLPVLEAMASGCPVISSDIPAIREVVNNAALLIEDPSNAEHFANAVTALENHEFRMRLIDAGLQRAKHFSLETQFSETMDFYRKIHKLKFGLPANI